MQFTFPKNTEIACLKGARAMAYSGRWVNISMIELCSYDYGAYNIKFEDNEAVFTYKTERLPDFEAMFPVFPYSEKMLYVNNISARLSAIEASLAEIMLALKNG